MGEPTLEVALREALSALRAIDANAHSPSTEKEKLAVDELRRVIRVCELALAGSRLGVPS